MVSPLADQIPALTTTRVYGGQFWLAYLANTALMVAVSVLFRYADFVSLLNGSAGQLGLIVGIGTTGALAMRVFQGVGIDRYGARRIWLLSLVMFVISMLAHLGIARVDGPAIYLVRILMTTSLAGAFGASITFMSLRVPENKMAEMIGTLGSSGFIGMALGPVLGDYLFDTAEVTRYQVHRMFLLAALAGAISLVCATFATRGHVRRVLRRHPSLVRLVGRYHPGMILLVSSAMGVGICLPHTFLRAYTAHLEINHISTFFLVYAVTAFAVRISIRELPERLGVRPMILVGMGTLAASILLYLVVGSEWHLAAPAVLGGIAHALLFPAVIAGGSLSFPRRYRGMATTLMLAMFDLGNLFGQPIVGGIIDSAERYGLPPYPTMFLTIAFGLIGVGVAYGLLSRTSEASVVRRRPRN